MDFLDPQKQKAHTRRLIAGYILIGMVLLLATIILLYQALGYGIDRHGKIFQNGLVFVSSVPGDAEIYVDGVREVDYTDARLALPAGQYVFEVKRAGYRPWKRAITVEGGTLQRFEYLLLFAETLTPTTVKQYPATPSMATQSPDQRWLLMQSAGPDTFDVFDLEDSNPTPQTFTVPIETISASTTTTSWEAIEWARDNQHVLLKRQFTRGGQAGSEYILLNREQPTSSRNLSVLLGFTPTQVQLRDKNYDQYFAFDQNAGILFTASLNEPTPRPYLEGVLAFQSEGADRVLYATSQDAPPGKTLLRLRQGSDRYTIRQVASDAAPYMLDLAEYEGAWYIAAGASGEDKVYVYKNPIDSLKSDSGNVLVPVHILKADNPNSVTFAPKNRFISLQSGPEFTTYDVRNNRGYAFQLDTPPDANAGAATWFDEFHLVTATAGQTLVFDYDGTNRQLLAPLNPATGSYFDKNLRRLYTLTDTNTLTVTDLYAPQDR